TNRIGNHNSRHTDSRSPSRNSRTRNIQSTDTSSYLPTHHYLPSHRRESRNTHAPHTAHTRAHLPHDYSHGRREHQNQRVRPSYAQPRHVWQHAPHGHPGSARDA